MPQHEDFADYFSGETLYGDDFDLSQIVSWHEDEAEAYADLVAGYSVEYHYVYHALNEIHGFRYLPKEGFSHALGFGSASGDEFAPLADRIAKVTIVDPSGFFASNAVHGIPATYVKPAYSGVLPFPDAEFDLIACLGVLHHIPNVSFVVSELCRVLKPGGYALIREPVVSMGDWRLPRLNLTKRERGIPLQLLRNMLLKEQVRTVSEKLCLCIPFARFMNRILKAPYNKCLITRGRSQSRFYFNFPIKRHQPFIGGYDGQKSITRRPVGENNPFIAWQSS